MDRAAGSCEGSPKDIAASLPSDVARDASAVIPDRAIRFPVRTILAVLGIVIGGLGAAAGRSSSRGRCLTWILVALFLAIALSPAVDWFQEQGIRRRGYAVALTSLGVAGVIALIGWLVVPPLVDQVNEFARRCPTTSTTSRRAAGVSGSSRRSTTSSSGSARPVKEGGASKVFGLSGTAISITKSVVTMVAAVITIIA